ncbi:corticoliberin [Notechis scutatus]|uniref:Corticoliberin n=1 Tax=Notechis scutatus TaxID=8663 RepID=A0A6J1VPU9_9SAUR|nr:corticoliberin [Notechis scutatus]
MKIQLLVSTGILLVALQPCHECRTLSKGAPAAPAASSALQQLDFQEQPQSLPVLLRMGEEYFLRLGSLRKNPAAAPAGGSGSFSSTASTSTSSSHLAASASASAGNFFRAVVQQLQQLQHFQERSLEGAPDSWDGEDDGAYLQATEKEKRSEEPPISLDLTFHLLREVLEMARAEQLAQQAHSNRKLMEIIGK